MTKVYVVNSGGCSDYGVDAIFSSRELAEEFMSLANGIHYNDIEEFHLDTNSAEPVKYGYQIFIVWSSRNGEIERLENEQSASPIRLELVGHRLLTGYNGIPGNTVLLSTVWAETASQAIDRANGHRLKMIKNGEWN